MKRPTVFFCRLIRVPMTPPPSAIHGPLPLLSLSCSFLPRSRCHKQSLPKPTAEGGGRENKTTAKNFLGLVLYIFPLHSPPPLCGEVCYGEKGSGAPHNQTSTLGFTLYIYNIQYTIHTTNIFLPLTPRTILFLFPAVKIMCRKDYNKKICVS